MAIVAILAVARPSQAQDTSDPNMFAGVVMDGLDIVTTSGTLTLHRVRATKAQLGQDQLSIVAGGVTMDVTPADNSGKTTVTSPQARYYHSAPEPPAKATEELPPTPTNEEVSAWRGRLRFAADGMNIEGAVRGDLLLYDPKNSRQVIVAFDKEQGGMKSSVLLWSAIAQRFIAMGGFELDMVNGASRARITGEALSANSTFSDWHYYVLDDKPVRIEYQNGSAQ